MKNNIFWIPAVIFLGLYLLLPKHSEYQVARYGQERAIVIDSHTGEAWVTEEYNYNNQNNTTLVPVGYSGYQKDEWVYTPNDRRNNKNISWLRWLSRKFSK
ncbi:MAG: hypothetical protein K2X90_02855 [Candidatus Babeliaceae bacterium]|nr:hypothetical protein [Candidatus Babeliaceae bacterium]